MKTTCLLFLTISCAALMQGTGYATPSNPASQLTSPEHTANRASDHVQDTEPTAPAKKDPRGHPSLAKASRPEQFPNNQEHSISGTAMHFHQSRLTKSGDAAKGGFQNEALNNALRVQPQGMVRPTVPSFNNVRHRSANPATSGGPANSVNKYAAAIDGTRMNRRP